MPKFDELRWSNQEYLDCSLKDQIEFDIALKRKAFRAFALGGGSLTDAQVGQTKYVREFRAQGSTWREMIAADSYVAGNMTFGIARNIANGFASATAVNQGNAIVITKIGLMSRDNLQLATFREIISKGFVTINLPTAASNQPIDNRPIQDFLCSMGDQVGVPALAVAVPADGDATELSAGMASFGRKFADLPDLAQPIPVVSNQSAQLVISGLAGAAAGSTPLWGVVPYFEGYEFVGFQN